MSPAPYPERCLREILKAVGGRLNPTGATGEVLRGLRDCYEAGQVVMRERAADQAGVDSIEQKIRALQPEGVR